MLDGGAPPSFVHAPHNNRAGTHGCQAPHGTAQQDEPASPTCMSLAHAECSLQTIHAQPPPQPTALPRASPPCPRTRWWPKRWPPRRPPAAPPRQPGTSRHRPAARCAARATCLRRPRSGCSKRARVWVVCGVRARAAEWDGGLWVGAHGGSVFHEGGRGDAGRHGGASARPHAASPYVHTWTVSPTKGRPLPPTETSQPGPSPHETPTPTHTHARMREHTHTCTHAHART